MTTEGTQTALRCCGTPISRYTARSIDLGEGGIREAAAAAKQAPTAAGIAMEIDQSVPSVR